MDKPTIFFSHSSNDRDMIFPIKEKIDDITGKSLNIFMSSDGQSIPFGHNWVHKIEEGLKDSQIMFVFVTPNSINSAWIYFEAGYAYSKGIEVIPVGIGVNIGQLKAPLNLLQGFDVQSADSLNNFISIINRKIDMSFKEDFSENDFNLINSLSNGILMNLKIHDIFEYSAYTMYSQCYDSEDSDKIIRYNLDKYFEDFKQYLDDNNIRYVLNDAPFTNKAILVSGIKISIIGHEVEPGVNLNGRPEVNLNHKMVINVSMYNFEKSILLLQSLYKAASIDYPTWFRFYFINNYTSLNNDESISSIISEYRDVFDYEPTDFGVYQFKNEILFAISSERSRNGKGFQYLVEIQICNDTNPVEIINLINQLLESKIIFKTLQK